MDIVRAKVCAELLRFLYKLRLIDLQQVHDKIDELQIRVFKHESESK